MPEAEIAIVVSPRDWAEKLHRFVADHGGARVRARVLDAREALEDDYAVLVAEDLTSFLTPRVMEELRRRGRRVLGVYDADEPWGAERLSELGVDETIDDDASPEEFVRIIESLAATADLDAQLTDLVGRPAADGTGAPHPPHDDVRGTRREGRRGLVVAVGGPVGGVGVTELTVALAVSLAGQGQRTVVVDADDVAPSLAQRLGLPLHPNIRTAVDAVEHRSGALEDALAELEAVGESTTGMQVLCGLPAARDWRQLRPVEIRAVVDELAASRDRVVVNTGPLTEDLAGQGGPPRFQLTRAMLAAADVLVGVCAPTPVGVARLLEWVTDVRVLAPMTELHLAVNRAPAERFKRGELEDEIGRSVAVPALAFLPHDPAVEEAAWNGTPVARGAFTREVDELAHRAAGVTARTARGG